MGLAVLLSAACGRVKVAGDAMAPTLTDGESVMVTRSLEPLERGDIVVFKYPPDESRSFMKRIVGLPGEQIEARAGAIVLNGRPLEERYVLDTNRSLDSWGPVKLADGEYFMLGDNRRNSSDSRSWGTVRRDLIWAKVMGR